MEPSTITSILQRCAQALEQTAIPNLTDPLALQRTMGIASLLNRLAPVVEIKGVELMEENQRMRQVLTSVLSVLYSEDILSRNAVNFELIERLIQKLKKVEAEFQSISEENYELKGILVHTINYMNTLEVNLPQEIAYSLRNQIRSLLREQLNSGIAHAKSALGRRRSEPLIKPQA